MALSLEVKSLTLALLHPALVLMWLALSTSLVVMKISGKFPKT
jgi:hypothetical protein